MHRCINTSWRQLALIKFWTKGIPECASAPLDLYKDSNTLQLIADLKAHLTLRRLVVAQIVTAKEQLAEHHQQQRIAAAFLHLQGVEWWHMRLVAVTFYTKQGADIIARLAQLDLSNLGILHLRDSSLGPIAMQPLAKGAWPKLYHIDLSNNLIDQSAMTTLILGDWPSLGELNLVNNPLLVADAIALIFEAASWKVLSTVNLQGVKLKFAGVHALKQLQSVKRTVLGSTDLQLADMSQSSLVSWPYLQELVLTNNKMGTSAVVALTAATMPRLTNLDLGSSSLDAAAAAQLIDSKWPQLERLCLKDNDLTDDAMAALAKCRWPNLRYLSLPGNHISAVGVEHLMHSEWPQLGSLSLDIRGLCIATRDILALVSHVFPWNTSIWRRDLAASTVSNNPIWPRLDAVSFK